MNQFTALVNSNVRLGNFLPSYFQGGAVFSLPRHPVKGLCRQEISRVDVLVDTMSLFLMVN